MKSDCQKIYRSMLSDFQRCMQGQLSETEKVESCFWVAYDYWNELKQKLKECPLISHEQEIQFFKKVKPRFTQYMEFYIILTEALMFVPAQKEAAILYWEEERRRVARFYHKNGKFIDYYDSGADSRDLDYFVRSAAEGPNSTISMIYDYDREFCTSHDAMVRSYLAHQRYEQFLSDRIAKLRGWVKRREG